MTIKLFELRDTATFIPIFAFDINGADGYLAKRAGYLDRCIVMGS